MKRIALILLLHVYALAAFGVGIRQFYCCGILKSTNLSFAQESTKKCKGEKEQDGCCKIEHKIFKVKDTHFAADGINDLAKQFISYHLLLPSLEVALYSKDLKGNANSSHAPPLYPITPIYILNCVYRI